MTDTAIKIIDFDRIFLERQRIPVIGDQASIIYLSDVSPQRQQQLFQYIERGYSYLHAQAHPLLFPPTTLVVVDSHPELGISFKDVGRRAVIWPEDWSDQEALWFFGHETTEAFVIHHFGQNAPRWLVESIAQLGAYRMCRYALDDMHTEGERECQERGFLPFHQLLDWRRPHLTLSDSPEHSLQSLTLEDIERLAHEYISQEHSTEIEDQKYATAWKMAMDMIPADMTLGQAMSHISRHQNLDLYAVFHQLNRLSSVEPPSETQASA